MMKYAEDEYLLLSGIQHYAFCRRQWALIHIEQQWAENYRTVSGELFHKRAHQEESVEKRGDDLIVRGLRIASASLGISGQCDVVEFHRCSEGIHLHKYEGLWSVCPVEYKRGKPKEGPEDRLQLCAQAMCMEEMFLTGIQKGYLFYGENRRREEVIFTSELRQMVEAMCAEMHDLMKKGYTPVVKSSKKCQACSLNEICVPRLPKLDKVSEYIRQRITGANEKEENEEGGGK